MLNIQQLQEQIDKFANESMAPEEQATMISMFFEELVGLLSDFSSQPRVGLAKEVLSKIDQFRGMVASAMSTQLGQGE